MFLFCMFSILCIHSFCIVLGIISPFVWSCPFPIFAKVYRPLPPGGNPTAVHHTSYIISYHTAGSICPLSVCTPNLETLQHIVLHYYYYYYYYYYYHYYYY